MILTMSVRMLYILVVCPVLLVSAVLTLTIDSQLGTSVEDCFERISIGEQLPSDAIYRNISELTTKECEQICKQDKQCQSYDYGVGAKGNATCNLGSLNETDIKDKGLLQRHPDYDVYVRRFQCEQSPPTPIQAQFDDPDGLLHRPTFKPVKDPKKPLSDELSDDLGSYGNNKPDYGNKPGYNNEKPDEYDNSKPDYDNPPSYGMHKPQDIPYRPERPQNHLSNKRPDPNDVLQLQDPYGRPRPQEVWRPEAMYGYRPVNINHDPSSYRPETPQYQYIIRPNRKPNQHLSSRPEPDSGYGNKPEYSSKPDPYGQSSLNQPSSPVSPPERPYEPNKPSSYPSKPDHETSYSYNSQYAGSYGNQQQDNSIYLEIYDPPRPFKPLNKPNRPGYGINQENYDYGHLGYGYDTFSSQNTHYNSHNSQYSGSGTLSENYRPNHDSSYRPTKPYDDQGSSYGVQSLNNNNNAYDSSSMQKPFDSNKKRPYESSYDSQGLAEGYGNSNQGGYGSSNYYSSSQSYAGNESYQSSSQSYQGISNKPYKKPHNNYNGDYDSTTEGYHGTYGGSTHSSSNKPYEFANQGYGSSSQSNNDNEQISYKPSIKPDSINQGYGSSHSANKPHGGGQEYGTSGQNYNNHDAHGSNNRPYDSGVGYGNSNYNSHTTSHTSSGYSGSAQNYHGSYGENIQSPSNKPYDVGHGYGGEISGSNHGSYTAGSNLGGSNTAYGINNRKPYGGGGSSSYKPEYEYESSSGYNTNQGSYGSIHSSNSKPYGNSQGYGGENNGNNNFESYGSRPNDKPYGSQGHFGSSSYDSNHVPYDNPSQVNNKPAGYGDNIHSSGSSGYNSRPSYSDNRPTSGQSSYTNQQDSQYSSQNSFESSSSYSRPTENAGNQKPGNQSGYNSGYDPDRPDIKPVYEYEIDRPSDVPSYIAKPNGGIITSRPVAVGDYGEKPSYGRGPGEPVSYKACFRRVLAGRRTLRSHVRRVVNCEHLEDCQRECAIEKRFHCESFNYRIDPSFRGKGLCELMTKPIEAFDIRRDFVEDKDYDFYELDRNSLEPNCPETLRGPGLLHSGFLSSKGPAPYVDRWKDRIDWYDRSSQSEYERYHSERRGYKNSHRRYHQDEVFVPYQIGVSRRSEEPETWGQYGGSYGGYNYYKDKTDYRKSINHWHLSEEARRGVKSQNQNSDFNYHNLGKNSGWESNGYGYGAWKRGRWNSSWNGLEYKEPIHYKNTRPHIYFESEDRIDDPSLIKDCSSRRRPGMSLGSGAIRRSLFAGNVVECEAACFGEKEFKCVSYSYRYSSSRGSDNCFLSERPYRGLDMSADSDSDVYAMPQDHGCSTISRKPWVESECFWHVRSDAAVGGGAARASLTVAGLGACEAECIRAHAFFCRGFSFRFESPTIGDDLENCILTSSPPTSLEIGRGLRPTIGHELYARGNYGRGCEPALYDDVQHRDTECYLQYDKAAKLKGTAVRGQARVKDEQGCGRACTDAPFRCLSFSYKNNARPGVDNCLLSEIRLFDLQRDVDYEHSTDDWLFAFDLFNGQCWRKVHGKEYDSPSFELPRPLPPPVLEYPASGPSGTDLSGPPALLYSPSAASSGPGFKPAYPSGPEPPLIKPPHSGPGFRPSYSPGYVPETAPSGPSGPEFNPGYKPSGPDYVEPISPGYKPGYPPSHSYNPPAQIPPRKPGYIPSPPSGPDYIPAYIPSSPTGPEYKPGYVPAEPSRPYPPPPPPPPPPQLPKPEYRPGQNRPIYQGDREESGLITGSWRQYTVSGFPCRRGTSCAQNHIAGHWACEPEGGEIGSWDYCCAPTHRCGYSEGFRKPWCYVGPSHEQWRPCSEKYYPYFKHNVPHPSQGHKEQNPSRPTGQWRDKPTKIPINGERLPGPYLPEADRKYWDELYKNGPSAYYDKHGNPLPGYTRVPTEERPRIKYQHNPPQAGSGTWVAVPDLNERTDHLVPEPLGAPRYWPVAYLHKGPPPNMTYFRYNETDNTYNDGFHSRENNDPVELPRERSQPDLKIVDVVKKGNDIEGRNIREKPTDNNTNVSENILKIDTKTSTTTSPVTTTTFTTTTASPTTTLASEAKIKEGNNETESFKNVTTIINTDIDLNNSENVKIDEGFEGIKGIDGKLEDFSKSLEVFELEESNKCDKVPLVKKLQAEERQIEAIGRLLASRRGGKLIVEKRSQKDLENKYISIDKDLLEFNFGNKFPVKERRGIVQRVSKDDIEKEKKINDKSLEVSETTFVRPPRVLSTTENIRKAIVNGKIFYDATIREQRDLFSNVTRKSKSLKLEEARAPSVISNNSYTKRKTITPRNTNPVKRVRRVFRKRYNPEEVRKRLLGKERSMKQLNITESNKNS